MISILTKKYQTDWETIRKTFILGEMVTFTDKMEETGKKYKAQKLTEWSQKEFIDLNGRKIGMDSQPEKGTTAWFSLPKYTGAGK